MADFVSASLEALTASLQEDGLGGQLSELTGSVDGVQGPVAVLDGTLELAVLSLSGENPEAGELAATLERLTSSLGEATYLSA